MGASGKGKLEMLPESVLLEIVEETKKIFGEELLSVVLYGSVARGDDTPESDVDIALFLREPAGSGKLDQMLSVFAALGLKYDRMFSPVDIDQGVFDKWADVLSYYQNIQKEGIVLWKAAA